MIFIFSYILIIYVLLILLLTYGFDKVKIIANDNLEPKTNFSIIVPFRNEENDFLNLLNSISRLNYPKNLFKIVVVDDESSDNSVAVFNKWLAENETISPRLLQNIRLSNAPKKDAIQTAIDSIKNDWIITTDADCVVLPNWLLAFDNLIQTSNAEMVAGAVSISKTNGFLNNFQVVDFLSLQGATIGSFGLKLPFMCNGANFAYTKKLFLELNGFEGNDKITSGDDVFLLQKAIKNCSEKVFYLKNRDAVVYTKSEKSWSDLFFQRVRWASKTSSYDGFFGKFLAVIVLLQNLSALLCFAFAPAFFCLIFISIKIIIDLILINKTNIFINNQRFIFPIIESLFYPIFSVSVAFYSFFGGFEWKNRRFKM